MSQSSHTSLSLIFRLIIVGLVLGLIYERAWPLVQDLGPNALLVSSVFWLSLLSPEYWLSHLSSLCYISALWAAANIFSALSKGRPFTSAFNKGLSEVASNLIYGALASLIITPTALRLLSGAMSLSIHYSLEALTLGLIGVVIHLVMKMGQSLSREIESFV